MRLISDKTRRTVRDSFQTFFLAVALLVFALLLTFLEDFAVYSKRPQWLVIGIETLSVILFIGDGLVLVGVVARIVARALREFADDIRQD
jgi:hypothetical protein